ncbi:CerR family C-terminal domain-containing protein [Persicirhabdus sediminis]|uniref:TetR/AcrR family transcriptional regulator n=1 Tax=Persicirhabdus sediminis TaxID=454144 RepID=A0A8J7MFG8_9BACT|nr:CerR family C-terminal domain-containing protein [Persicirhabdus sediminis]MBK1791776.1 TetR/AcrR family transcriptional regulator [Persicirhabdus sediminis]
MAAEKTKDRLIRCAVEAFAEHGYRDTTVADICERAEANIAAVNYHFGSKEKLFRMAMRRALDLVKKHYPVAPAPDENFSIEERLRIFMSSLIKRHFDKGEAGHFARIMSHEGTRQDAPHAVIFEEIQQAEGDLLHQIITEMTHASEVQIQLTKMSTVGLCLFPLHKARMLKNVFPDTPSTQDIDDMIEQQYQFALAGINQIASIAKSN